jgi:conjugative transfer pilus assembly protein TraH
MLKRIIAISLIANLSYADMNSQMDDFFNDSVAVNYNSAAVVKSQQATYLSGGSAALKTPVQNLQVARVQFPSINAGCGGIDLFTGGFSFINSQELIAFGKNIMQNAAPMAVQLALTTFAPKVVSTLNEFRNMANEINNFNMSSCQAAEVGVKAISGSYGVNELKSYSCKNFGTINNTFSSWLGAKQACTQEPATANNVINQAKAADKLPSIIAPNRNVTWYLLNKNHSLDKSMAEYIISLVGTVIYGNNLESSTSHNSLFQDSNSPIIKALLFGSIAKSWSCTDSTTTADDGCLIMSKEDLNITTGLITKVKILLQKLNNDVEKGANSLTEKETNFLMLSGLPVTAITKIDKSMKTTTDLESFAEVIAYQILQNYINNMIEVLQVSMSNAPNPQDDDLIRLQKNASRVSFAISQASQQSLQRLANRATIIQSYYNKKSLMSNGNRV